MRSEFNHQPNESWYRSRGTVIVGMIAVIMGFFIIREHWEHLTGKWIYLLLLLCPLMLFFGHGGHGGHGKTDGSNEQNS